MCNHKQTAGSLLAGLAAAVLLLGGCRPGGAGASSVPGAAESRGSSAASAPMTTGPAAVQSPTSEEASTTMTVSTRETASRRPTATQKPPAPTTATAAPTSAPSVKGHISKSDTSVEPVRPLKEIMAGLTSADLLCDGYDREKYLTPYWKGNIVYNEALNFVRDPKTGTASAPLLYGAEKILSVKNAALDVTYTEGVDYTYANGRITLTANSAIHCFDYEDVYFKQEKSGACFPLKNGGYTLFREGTYFHANQVAVTYVHSQPWKGYKPAYQGALVDLRREYKNGVGGECGRKNP